MNGLGDVSLLKNGKMLLALLVLDWLFAGSTDATTHEPGFTGPIANVTTPLGREAILACTVHNLSTYKVAWLRVDTQTILTIQSHVISRSRRVGVTHGDHTWFLHIRELRETDRGWYMCQINTDPMKSQLGYLDVVVPPDILDRGTSRDQTVREGASVSLTCAATGSPQPQIIWRREHSKSITLSDGIQVSSLEGPVLNISRVSRQHAGAYLCIASNGVPPTVSKRILLTVEFPPVITIRNQLVGAALGSDLVLECDTEAYPKPVSYWSRDNGEIVPVGGGLEPQKFDGAFRSVLRLPIKRVMSSDYGAYKCVSKNALGDTEGTIKLYPMPKPAPESKNVIQRMNIVADTASEITPFGTQDFRLQDYNRAISMDGCGYGFLLSLVILIKITTSRG
ncbi:lachesin-like [Choristoneura fumiferana]|uniref:lachesin-like n=1 Tax=Choristoneura fumiferana TaxID=7141 RepID=UPI003D1566DF